MPKRTSKKAGKAAKTTDSPEGLRKALAKRTKGELIVSFRQACVKRFGRCGIVGCQHTNLWRTADAYQKDTPPARPAGRGPAAIRALAADP